MDDLPGESMVDALKRRAKATEAAKPAEAKAPEAKAPEAKASAEVHTPVKKKEAEDAIPVFFWVVLACLAVAIVGSVVQESAVLEGGSLFKWYEGLFEEHVVPPPIAHDHLVTIQFCQS